MIKNIPEFDTVVEVRDEMIVVFGADIEDIIEGPLGTLTKDELEAVYELMTIAYENGQQEA